jgi:hypothetical protein
VRATTEHCGWPSSHRPGHPGSPRGRSALSLVRARRSPSCLMATASTFRPGLARLASSNLDALQWALLDAALSATTTRWATVACGDCGARSRVELPVPDVFSQPGDGPALAPPAGYATVDVSPVKPGSAGCKKLASCLQIAHFSGAHRVFAPHRVCSSDTTAGPGRVRLHPAHSVRIRVALRPESGAVTPSNEHP